MQHNLASTQQTKSPVGSFIDETFAKESQNSNYDNVFGLVHGISGSNTNISANGNKTTNFNSNVNTAVSESNKIHQQQLKQQQQYNCIIKWVSASKSDDGWRCPACQNVEKDVPHDYYCFCGKLKNPTNNRQDIASCGEVCGRVEGCSHSCTLNVIQGLVPCQAQVKRECGCGKSATKENALLQGESRTKCHCSKQERQVTCTRESHDKHNYSCGKTCGKDLSCGNHKCKDCCHPNECRPRKLSPDYVTSVLGKMPIDTEQRTSCLDPIPVCGGVCGKTFKMWQGH
ncbi:Protein shuttle craft [Eumeta japonica]|uniref:Protein shuttle craft n=1 Tax=Eumeta variegata TaxID=151549 RepID=A0A4C1SC66_EUMVA|nr:Protein shuttle craft [Eumeta japonica]